MLCAVARLSFAASSRSSTCAFSGSSGGRMQPRTAAAVRGLAEAKVPAVVVLEPGADGALEPAPVPTGALVYPGSFNPLHNGHLSLAAAAQRHAASGGGKVYFVVSSSNADKPETSEAAVLDRLAQFTPAAVGLDYGVALVANAPLFVDMAGLFVGGATRFVLGVDTLQRVLNPKYYGGREAMVEALGTLCDPDGLDCAFVVGGRREAEAGQWVDALEPLAEAALPPRLAGRFSGLGEAEFRVDVSSTALRRERGGA